MGARPKNKGQKHQNKRAFEIQFDTKAIEDNKKVILSQLCKRCVDQIMWKLQFNKYKRQTQPSRCNICMLKIVVKTYHQACDHCAKQKDICSKCLRSNEQVKQPDKVPILDPKKRELMTAKEEEGMNTYLLGLRERSKRSVMRGYQKESYLWDATRKLFTDKEGQPLEGLKFRNNKDDQQQQQIDQEDSGNESDSVPQKCQIQDKMQGSHNKEKEEQNNEDEDSGGDDENDDYMDLEDEDDEDDQDNPV